MRGVTHLWERFTLRKGLRGVRSPYQIVNLLVFSLGVLTTNVYRHKCGRAQLRLAFGNTGRLLGRGTICINPSFMIQYGRGL